MQGSPDELLRAVGTEQIWYLFDSDGRLLAIADSIANEVRVLPEGITEELGASASGDEG